MPEVYLERSQIPADLMEYFESADCGRCYVCRMVEVFREVRRVLASHGTVWLNLGDSYAHGTPGGGSVFDNGRNDGRTSYDGDKVRGREKVATLAPGLKAKDLVGVPWRVVFALQADGWYLRSDIIWAKPNPMPESVTDRPTKAHEYVFLLSKQPRYFFDQEAVREANSLTSHGSPRVNPGTKADAGGFTTNGQGKSSLGYWTPETASGRNIRSVWEIATQPYPEAHFATFPEELARRCIAAGCPEQVCRVCGKARERIVDKELVDVWHRNKRPTKAAFDTVAQEAGDQASRRARDGHVSGHAIKATTLGFTDCGHDDYRTGLTLDPFIGSGTVAYVARKLGRHALGIDLNESYLELAARRLQQQSLFASEVAS